MFMKQTPLNQNAGNPALWFERRGRRPDQAFGSTPRVWISHLGGHTEAHRPMVPKFYTPAAPRYDETRKISGGPPYEGRIDIYHWTTCSLCDER
jgi:hypothetical protein